MERAVWPAALVAAFVGCSGSPPPAAKEPPPACPASNPVLALSASDRANASEAGQGRPVQVRVYLLKSDARLLVAKFEEIWQNDAAVLDGDLVKVDEYTVYPGETKLVKVASNADAKNLATVALFREPQGKNWFVTYELEAPHKAAPCPPSEPRISVFLDRMQIADGQGRATGSESRGAGADPAPERGSTSGAAGSKGN